MILGYLTDGNKENDKDACEEIIKLLNLLNSIENDPYAYKNTKAELEQIENPMRNRDKLYARFATYFYYKKYLFTNSFTRQVVNFNRIFN